MTHTQLPVMLDWEAENLLEAEKDVVVVDVTIKNANFMKCQKRLLLYLDRRLLQITHSQTD